MLPKVATHLFHHTSRAVAAVQNQTGHSFRNVLQLQSSSSPSSAAGNIGNWNGATGSSNSGWNGTGSGGAKSHPGQRFYTGYTGVGRVVTQADSSAAHNHSLADDSDDVNPQVIGLPQRARRNSIAVDASSRIEGQTSTVSRRTPFSVKPRHVLADRPFNGKPESVLLPKIRGTVLALQPSSASPLPVVRFESTVPLNAATDSAVLPPISPVSPLDVTATDNAQELTGSLPTPPLSPVSKRVDSETLHAIATALASGSSELVRSIVKDILASEENPSAALCNASLSALAKTWVTGHSASYIIEALDAFLARGVRPNVYTYASLLRTFTERDYQLFLALKTRQDDVQILKACGITRGIEAEEEELKRMKEEFDASHTLRLFRDATAKSRPQFRPEIYVDLLHSCSIRGNVDAALQVCNHYEKYNDYLWPKAYAYLIEAYGNAGDLKGAKTVFEEFKRASAADQISWFSQRAPSDKAGQSTIEWRAAVQTQQIGVWNHMLQAHFKCGDLVGAVDLLEQMLDTSAVVDFLPTDVPPPAETTLSTVIRGFYEAGDVNTALAWFEKLLDQDAKPAHPLKPAPAPTRPGTGTWNFMLTALLIERRVEDVNRLYDIFMHRFQYDGLQISSWRRPMLVLANLHYLDSNPTLDADSKVAILDFLFDTVCHRSFSFADLGNKGGITVQGIYRNLFTRYLDLARVDSALSVAEIFFKQQLHIALSESPTPAGDDQPLPELAGELMDRFTALPAPTLPQLLRAAAICDLLTVPMTPGFASRLVQAHSDLEKQGLTKDLTTEDLDVIRRAVGSCAAQGQPGTPSSGSVNTGNTIESPQSVFADTVPLKTSSPGPPVPTPRTRSSVPDSQKPFYQVTTAISAYEQLNADLQRGIMPRVENVSRLITWLGRLGELDKVRHLYQITQDVLLSLEHSKERQSSGWFMVEDSMIIALAHAGEVEAAHVHRARIIEQGGTPSADAYGALIHHVKDTTDDTSNAMALYQESQFRGVRPNLYLYNTIISKLAKARKADYAIQLFREMRINGVSQTSVTFGAVIAACCRVGDAESAERLFKEMIMQPNFKPRVPPYNTMMQLYTQTKPNRERALFYYDALRNAQVRPTAHTYKLLLDVYGSIEPVDLQSMEQMFAALQADSRVPVQGTHWASLINSYGCVQKDLDKVLSIFNSIATHSSTKPGTLPDAVVFESLFNVLVTLRRTDLFDHYTEELPRFGVHMTAYIANLLIKGFAASGNMDRARAVFESLVDPPQGVAAPHNHGPREGEHSESGDLTNAPVYREPSTWEAMVRAELGNGSRDRALALLTRVQSRQFPTPVFQRISGILLDESVSPWASDASAPSSSPASASL